MLAYGERDAVDAVLHMARDATGDVNQDVVRHEAERFAGYFTQRAR